LDGARYEARDGDELARWIGYLPQLPSLLAGSIKDNISRFSSAAGADPAAVDRGAVRAAMAAGAHRLIQRLPQGYDTVLGPYGQGLSAGQAQRVALARALYRDPVLMVLDEPNSHLDQEGEAALKQAILAATARGAAVVVVAHRAGVLARVDRLLVMRHGSIHLEGPREEVLMKMCNAPHESDDTVQEPSDEKEIMPVNPRQSPSRTGRQ
jgi:ATP-binding cassette subfamily C protein